MRFVRLSWITKGPGGAWVGSVPNKHNPSTKSGQDACISSRITMVIHVMNDHQINDNCFNEPFAVSPCRSLYWDMHGLIFETSIWLLAGSTRFVCYHPAQRQSLRRSKPRVTAGSCIRCKAYLINTFPYWTLTQTPLWEQKRSSPPFSQEIPPAGAGSEKINKTHPYRTQEAEKWERWFSVDLQLWNW